MRGQRVGVDLVISPTRGPKAPIVQTQSSRRFANSTHIRQCTGQFGVPRLQRMQARAAIAKTEPVIAAGDNFDQTAGRTGVRIVVGGEDASGRSHTQTEWIPKSPGPALHCAAILGATEKVAPFALTGGGDRMATLIDDTSAGFDTSLELYRVLGRKFFVAGQFLLFPMREHRYIRLFAGPEANDVVRPRKLRSRQAVGIGRIFAIRLKSLFFGPDADVDICL